MGLNLGREYSGREKMSRGEEVDRGRTRVGQGVAKLCPFAFFLIQSSISEILNIG